MQCIISTFDSAENYFWMQSDLLHAVFMVFCPTYCHYYIQVITCYIAISRVIHTYHMLTIMFQCILLLLLLVIIIIIIIKRHTLALITECICCGIVLQPYAMSQHLFPSRVAFILGQDFVLTGESNHSFSLFL